MTKCRKRRYRDEVGAKFALAIIRRQDKAHREDQEQRAYKCPRCRGWHLTHLETWQAA